MHYYEFRLAEKLNTTINRSTSAVLRTICTRAGPCLVSRPVEARESTHGNGRRRRSTTSGKYGCTTVIGRGPGRPAKTRGPPRHGGRRSDSSSSTPRIMGRRPGRPMKTRGPPQYTL